MSHKASPTLIGIFTLVGLLLGGAALLLFGAGKFFEKSSNIQLYFDQSANGLLVGSEVRFGGVLIGHVTSMKVLVDTKRNRKIIPVVVQLSTKDLADISSTSGEGIDLATEDGVRKAVAQGLCARMKQQSLLTGKLYIEFDIAPAAEFYTYQPDVKPPYPIVPTMGTEMDELIAGVADGLKKFNSLDLGSAMKELHDVLDSTKAQIAALNVKEINDNLVGITTDVRALVGNKKLSKAIDSLDEALTGIDELTIKANKGFEPLLKDLEKVLQQANAGLAKIDEATNDIARVTNPRAPVLMRLQNALEEAERAAQSVKELANDMKQNPNSIILGKDHKP